MKGNLTVTASVERLVEVGLDQLQQHLRLRVAEPAVKLDHPRADVGEHQLAVEQPAEWGSVRCGAGVFLQ